MTAHMAVGELQRRVLKIKNSKLVDCTDRACGYYMAVG